MNSREEVWIRAWSAVANANDCKTPETARNWADQCLKEFDKRFPRKQFERELHD